MVKVNRAYAKFSGVPLQTCVTNNPFWTPNGRLPVFKHGKQVLSSLPEISAYLKQKNFSADFGLTQKQCADAAAYTQLLKEKLHLALQYVWWLDTKNYTELIRPWYAKALPFPYNYYYPGKYEQEAKKHLEALYDQDDDPLTIESSVYGEAEKCLTVLSVRLGDQEFFFGSHPTSLDATVYAFLAPLLKVPFPSPALQNYLKACTNLVKFVVRITQRYFPYAIQEYEAKKSAESGAQGKSDPESDFPNRRRYQIVAGIFATAAMTGYALSTGLVQMSTKDEVSENSADYKDLFQAAENTED
ncbi:metaxin-1 isoform X2 [Zootermopsis nevadensis]|uniref:metaxin-1 isoform X2 n=1 Tax=Zootermopsis nevadensis TaxID=136037 RepID=UPI000B8E4071|nr:metaxin-1 isoform X2 [Zootermopsis nevadensis]